MCDHLTKFERKRTSPVHASGHGCKECLEAGDVWVHLRLCMSCGHVGCCDDSPNQHATRHHHATKHPVIKSFEPGEDWAWCFVHEDMLESMPTFPEESPPQHYDPPGAHAT